MISQFEAVGELPVCIAKQSDRLQGLCPEIWLLVCVYCGAHLGAFLNWLQILR